MGDNFDDCDKWGCQAGDLQTQITALKRNKPVPIEEVPEEWKDGRILIGYRNAVDPRPWTVRFKENGQLHIDCVNTRIQPLISKVMLPPSIQESQ